MNYRLILESCEEYDCVKATATQYCTMYEDALAIRHAENSAQYTLFQLPNGKTCGAIPVTLCELENMRMVKEWPHPSQLTVTKLKKMTTEEKFKKLLEMFLDYEQCLKELHRKYNNELIATSTRHMVEAHGELDRNFINSIRPLFSNP